MVDMIIGIREVSYTLYVFSITGKIACQLLMGLLSAGPYAPNTKYP